MFLILFRIFNRKKKERKIRSKYPYGTNYLLTAMQCKLYYYPIMNIFHYPVYRTELFFLSH